MHVLLTYLIFLKQNSTSTGFYPLQMPVNYPVINWKNKRNLVNIKRELRKVLKLLIMQ